MDTEEIQEIDSPLTDSTTNDGTRLTTPSNPNFSNNVTIDPSDKSLNIPTSPIGDSERTTSANDSTDACLGFNFYGGIDIGAYNTTVCSSAIKTPLSVDVVPNSLSHRSTPTVLSLIDDLRLVGEPAMEKIMSNPLVCVTLLPLLMKIQNRDDLFALKKRFGPLVSCLPCFVDNDTYKITLGDMEVALKPAQILAGFIRQIASLAVDDQNRRNAQTQGMSLSTGRYCLAIPDSVFNCGKQVLKAWIRSCRSGALNVEGGAITSRISALNTCWIGRNLQYTWQQVQRKAIVVGICSSGFSETSVSLMLVREDSVDCKNSPSNESEFEGKKITILSTVNCPTVGAADLLRKLGLHIEEYLNKHGVKINEYSRAFGLSGDGADLTPKERKKAIRIHDLAVKLMKDLSAASPASATYSDESADVVVQVRRETFESLIADELKEFSEFISQSVTSGLAVLEQLQLSECPCFIGMEIVGGASRVPVIQECISVKVRQALTDLLAKNIVTTDFNANNAGTSIEENVEQSVLRRTLDGSSSAGTGATFISTGLVPHLPGVILMKSLAEDVWESEAQREEYMTTERKIRTMEQNELERLAMTNALEAKIIEYETLCKREKALVGGEELLAIVEEVSEWFYGEAFTKKTCYEVYKEKLDYLESSAQSLCSAYFDSLQLEKLKREKEMEAIAAAAAANGPRVKDYNDTRQLTAARRLKLASMNKDEGNDLLKAGALGLAMQHYEKALGHLDKISDETPEEKEQKILLQVSCNLNLAQTYIKEGSPAAAKRALSVCETTLKLQPRNPKALYRRAMAHEKLKEWSAAKDDLKQCINIDKQENPEQPDISLQKALERIEQKLKAEQTESKRVFSRMFGFGGK